jgi:Transposase IS4
LTVLDAEDIALISGVVETDNDNDPLPENLPTTPDTSECVYAPVWGHSGLCHRRMAGATNSAPERNFPITSRPTLLDNFELFFPKQFVTDTILPVMNRNAQLGMIQYGEFLRWLGIWFLMATIQGPARYEFWKKDPIDPFVGAPICLNEYMSRNRFQDILTSLQFTDGEPPNYVDKFFRIRDLVNAWNGNMTSNFTPGWINCLDESMMVWSNQWTCPGFMFVPRKPHPFGNEWHSFCCGVSGKMFAVELVEGKDRP